MKPGQWLAPDRVCSLDDGGDENGESYGEHADGLILDPFHFIGRDFSIPKMRHNRHEAEKVLGIDCDANSNSSDVWVGGNALVVHGGGERRDGYRR
jgi:hypothetical protein